MILENDAARKWLLDNSPFFSADELMCKCGCGTIVIDTKHIIKLNILRLSIGSPLHINSGYRCPAHNADVGGVAASYHPKGAADDVDTPTKEFQDAIYHAAEPLFNGIGRYSSFIHLDSRPYKARW